MQAGIVGKQVGKSVDSCTNDNLRLIGTDNIGGIVGLLQGSGTIKNCENLLNIENLAFNSPWIKVNGSENVGGICGEAVCESGTITLDTNYNAGQVKGGNNVAGIIGKVVGNGRTTIVNNTNKATGEVKADSIYKSWTTGEEKGNIKYTGGIVGLAQDVTMTDNKNQAAITGQDKVGGVAGRLEVSNSSGNSMTGNINLGKVTGINVVGGLVGENSSAYRSLSTIDDNQNYGNVIGEEVVAGLVGKNIGPSQDRITNSTVKNCTNAGDVFGNEMVAGCIGTNSGKSEKNKNNGWIFAKPTTVSVKGTNAKNEDVSPTNSSLVIKGSDSGSVSTTITTILNYFVGDVMIDKDTSVDKTNDVVPPYGKGQNTVTVKNGSVSVVVVPAGAGSVTVQSLSMNPMGLLAKAESDYVFSGWVVNGKYVSIQPLAFFDTSKAITVCAVFFKHGESNPKRSIENYDPNATATPKPTAKVTVKPTQTATPKPTAKVTVKPTQTATPKPTAKVTVKPTQTATPKPTAKVTVKPTQTATPRPTQKATAKPTATVKPSATPTTEPVASNVKVGEVLIDQNTSADPASDLVPPYGKGQNSKQVQARNLLVAVVPVGAGSVSVTFISNDQTGLLATATKGYAFSGWVVDGKYVSTQAQTFFGVSEEMKVSAVFYKQGQKDPKSEIENYLPSQTETPAPGQSEAPNPTPGNSPMPNPIPSPAPGVSPLPSPVPGAGSTIIGVPTGGAVSGSVVTGAVVKDGTYIYVITNPTKHYCKVTGVVASKKKTIKFIKVPNAIRLSGVKYRVTAIDKNAFKGLKKVTKVRIDTNVKTIGIKAFYNCKKIKKVTIRTKKLKKIGKFAFKNINKKATIKVPKKQLKKYTKMLKKSKVKKTVKIR